MDYKETYEKYPYPIYQTTIEDIRSIFKNNGYKLIKKMDDRYGEDITNITIFHVKNKGGYSMLLNIENINAYKGLQGVVRQSNPFLLENINIWTKNKKLGFKLIKKRYYESHYDFRVTTPLLWICDKNKEHIWSETWEKIKEYETCPFCNGRFTKDIKESLLFKFPWLSKEVDSNKNYYDLSYIKWNSNDKLNWVCHNCGNKYKKSAYQRTVKDKSCPVCKGKMNVPKNNLGRVYPHIVKYWHPYRNEFSPYEIEYDGDLTVWFKCPQFGGRCGHVWKSKLSEAFKNFMIKINPSKSKISNGRHYCPYCYNIVDEKNLDPIEEVGFNKYIYDYLSSRNINVKREVKIGAISPKGFEMPYDIGIFDKNEKLLCLIEYQGEQHTQFVKLWHKTKRGFVYQKEKDLLKRKFCEDNDISLELIYYYENKNINSILKNITRKYIEKEI